jgi:AraC-like DNA-binding protein
MVLPAIQSLPLAVHLRASNDPGRAAVADILRLLRNEVETADFGNQIVVRHLLSTLFVYVLREWADAASPLAGNWFSALRSPHIARALACIHEAPANDWTLDALAEAAGLSRSAFAAQFRTSGGEPPTPGAQRIAAGGNCSPRRLQIGICFQPRLRTRSRAFTGAVPESGQLH